MKRSPYRIGLLCDFNVHNLAVLIRKGASPPGAECSIEQSGQMAAALLNEKLAFWTEEFDALVVWALPHLAIPQFGKALACEPFAMAALLDEVDAFCELVRRTPSKVRSILVPTLVLPAFDRGLGPLDLVSNVGIANALMRINARMVEQLSLDKRVIVLDAHRWLAAAGVDAYSPRLWYLSKTPFQSTVYREAGNDILAALDGIHGRNRKVVVLDLDNTLWGGVVGDDGWEKLRIGGHDPVGEAFVDFQKGLKRLINRGILLTIVSKNEESTALDAMRRHPEMILRPEDFAGWRINWRDKAENIAELIADLNLGLDAAVFIDDSAFECARIRDALPEVLTLELPVDPMMYPSFLARLRCFDNSSITDEDRARTSMYVADRQRTGLKAQGLTLAEWLDLLDLRVIAETLNEVNLERAAQLLNKTNQMNLGTRRLAAHELLAWASLDRHHLWTFRIADRFGDYGLCGISSFVQEEKEGKLVDFLLSCRAMGRGVEETMLSFVAQQARGLGCEELLAALVPTARNQPCARWFAGLPNVGKEDNIFRLLLSKAPDLPTHVQVTWNRVGA